MTDLPAPETTTDVAALLGQLREAEELNTFYKQRNINLSAAINRLGSQIHALQNELREWDPDWGKEEVVPEPEPEAPRARKRPAK